MQDSQEQVKVSLASLLATANHGVNESMSGNRLAADQKWAQMKMAMYLNLRCKMKSYLLELLLRMRITDQLSSKFMIFF